MKRLRVFLAPLLVCIFAAVALAQSGGGYDLSWSTVPGGGGTVSGGGYTIQGTIGQSEGGETPLQGGDFSMQGGNVAPAQTPSATPTPGGPTATPTRILTPTPTRTAAPARLRIYLPLVLK